MAPLMPLMRAATLSLQLNKQLPNEVKCELTSGKKYPLLVQQR